MSFCLDHSTKSGNGKVFAYTLWKQEDLFFNLGLARRRFCLREI